MELSESFLHGDTEEDESEYAIRKHEGFKPFEPCESDMPRDFEGGNPQFLWLGESFDSFLPNDDVLLRARLERK